MQLGDFTSSSFSLDTLPALLAMKVRDFAYDESDERHYGKGLERQGQPEPMPPSPKRDPFQTNWGFGQPVEHDAELEQVPYPSYDDHDQDMSEAEFVAGWYRCLYDFVPEGPAEMAMTAGDLYHIVSRCGPVGWVIAVNEDGTTGIVPEGYVTLERRDDDFEDDRSLPEHEIKADEDLLETPTASETPTSSNGSMDEDAPPTPHAGDDFTRPLSPSSQETEKPQLSRATSEQAINGVLTSDAAAAHPSGEVSSEQAAVDAEGGKAKGS